MCILIFEVIDEWMWSGECVCNVLLSVHTGLLLVHFWCLAVCSNLYLTSHVFVYPGLDFVLKNIYAQWALNLKSSSVYTTRWCTFMHLRRFLMLAYDMIYIILYCGSYHCVAYTCCCWQWRKFVADGGQFGILVFCYTLHLYMYTVYVY